MTLKVYQFENKLRNRMNWPRTFVAFSLRDACSMAKRWCEIVNEANGYQDDLMLTFDYENVTILEVNRILTTPGYVELD